MTQTLTPDIAARFADIALGHVTREYPNKLDHVMDGPQDVQGPSRLHPIFYGSFDWHSCVHGYWLLARLLRLYPDMAPAARVRDLLDRQLTPDKVAGEVAYLARPSSAGFERPYGWAWALKLQAELTEGGAPWAQAMQPLAEAFAARFKAHLPKLTYPIRVGTHFNSAFALRLALDYARTCGDDALAALIGERLHGWFGDDAGCQAWEPSGDEFLSSALMEAEAMRAAMAPDAFRAWFAAFLPDVAARRPATLFQPATVSDRSDGKIAHLDGLNLSRAWCWRAIAGALDAADPARGVALETADAHLASALPHVAGDYMGEHWLASFALLALEAG
jgi:hypothetical protein